LPISRFIFREIRFEKSATAGLEKSRTLATVKVVAKKTPAVHARTHLKMFMLDISHRMYPIKK
jgi:hypothetical protein